MEDDAPHTWLALGDSYTIGESVLPGDRYPVQAVKKLRAKRIHFKDPHIIAATGWTTADLLSAMQQQNLEEKFDIVTLLIGVNNQYQHRSETEYSEQFTEILQKSIELADNDPTHVTVLSIPDYSVTPFAHDRDKISIAKQIDSFNLVNKTISDSYRAHYLYITKESRKATSDPSLIAEDGLHYSRKEYSIWADMLFTVIKKTILGK